MIVINFDDFYTEPVAGTAPALLAYGTSVSLCSPASRPHLHQVANLSRHPNVLDPSRLARQALAQPDVNITFYAVYTIVTSTNGFRALCSLMVLIMVSATMTYTAKILFAIDLLAISETLYVLLYSALRADAIIVLLPRLDILAIYRRHLITIQRIREDY